MGYPEKIDEHSKSEWKDSEWFSNGPLDYVRSYFHRASGMIGMHSSEFYELNIVVDGTGRHYFDHYSFKVSPGCAFMVPPYVRHGYWTDKSMNIFHALIKCSFFEKYDYEPRNLPGFTMLCEIEPYIRTEREDPMLLVLQREHFKEIQPDLEALVRLESSHYAGRDIIKSLRLLCVIGMLSSYTSSRRRANGGVYERNDQYSLSVARIMERIRMNPGMKLTIDELAEQSNMTRSTFIRQFRRVCGRTPTEFRTHCRVVQARKLLCYTNMPLTSIALECGFCDCSHFIHTFSRREGMGPSDYRRLHSDDLHYSNCSICARPNRPVSAS